MSHSTAPVRSDGISVRWIDCPVLITLNARSSLSLPP
jgi:hypothetical protein